MRLFRRFLPLLCAMLFAPFFAAGGGTAGAQTLAPSEVFSPLPPKWNDAVRALADKIAAAAKPSRVIALDVKNISSLGASAVTPISQSLQAKLSSQGLRVVSIFSADAEARVKITLSENVDAFVWVGEVARGDEPENAALVEIVSVPKPGGVSGSGGKDSLLLERKLVWAQRGKILDFALFASPGGNGSELVILEADRLAFYRLVGAQWQPWTTVTIPHSQPWPRDLLGRMDADSGRVSLPGVECLGDFAQPDQITCAPAKTNLLPTPLDFTIPGHEQSVTAPLRSVCGGGSVVLATGTGDWTEPDSIEGYELDHGEAIPSGDSLAVSGPVISLWPANDGSSARAVVHNLRTGEYEAYVVTTTCNR